MAPRTPEQQKEYNAKRRAENAAKKAEAYAQVKLLKAQIKAEKKAIQDVASADAKAKPSQRMVDAKRKKRAEEVKEAVKLKAIDEHKEKVKRDFVETTRSKPVVVAPDDGEGYIKPVVKSDHKPAKPTTGFEPTNSRTYVRNKEGSAGYSRTKHAKVYQTTVTFTESQYHEIRDKALFNQVSLAEQIRWCVVQFLNVGRG